MKHRAAAFGLLLAVAELAPIQARADIVTDWNKTAVDVLRAARIAGNPWSRSLAMVHVAISDAINTVQNRYLRHAATMPADSCPSTAGSGCG